MGLTQGQIDKLLPQWMKSAADAEEGQRKVNQVALKGNFDADEGLADRDAALSRLITGKDMDESADQAKAARDMQNAQDLRQQYGQEVDVASGQTRIGGFDPLARFLKQRELQKPSLTPAQEMAEKTVGKQIADYQASGGRPAMEKNLSSLRDVQSELQSGKRDGWDRGVGAVFGTSPGLLGVFGSAEKERRDKARNTALTIAKQTDPNPTEKQIETIMGQIYDPASSNSDNQARIDRFLQEQEEKAAQMSQASDNYNQSGYATVGGVFPETGGVIGNRRQAPAPAGQPQQADPDAKARRLQELRAKKARGEI